ncbi:MAG: disulfide bond formation protein DsbB [Candidatus Thiodiazotropha endolucinida]
MLVIQKRLPWLLLAVSALILEAAALYFQYGLDLDPCVLCIYQRAAVMGIFVSALIGMSAPTSSIARWIGYIGWGVAAGWCLYLALELSGLQLGIVQPSLSCDVNAKFPVWLKLDRWLPAVFQPTGFCGDIQWQFLGLSMPLWMVVIMVLQLIVLGVVVLIELRAMLNR